MASSVVIGRVAVRVLPDTSNFRRDAQAKLDALEKKLKVEIPTTVDMLGAEKDLLTGIREMNAKNRTTESRKVKLYTTLDTTTMGMRESLNKVVRKYEEMSRTNQVKLKTDLVAADLELNLDEKNLKHIKEEIDHFRRQESPVKIPVELEWSTRSALTTRARLALLTRPREAPIVPKVDNKALATAEATLAALSGGRLLKSVFKDFREFFSNLDKNIPLISTIALAIAGLAGWGATAAANLFALASSLAQIGPAALALPGILGGMAVGLTVTLVAFKDIGKIVPEVKSAWTQLKGTISDNFWKKAAAPIRDMVDRLLPHFVHGFAGASTAIGGYFGSLAKDIGHAFDGPVRGMFEDLITSVHIATTGTKSFAGIITTLGKTGASYLPRLAKFFVDLSDRFDSFLTKSDKNGNLGKWIDNGIEQLKALGRVATNLGGIFAGLSRAMTAAGGSTLSVFASTLEKVHKVVDSPGFQKGMTQVFQAAFVAMHNIGSIAGPAMTSMFTQLGRTLSQILPKAGIAIGKLGDALARLLGSTAVQDGLKSMFDGIAKGMDALGPSIKSLGPALGQLMTLIGQMAASFLPLLGEALSAAAPAFVSLLQAAIPVVRILAGGLTAAIKIVSPIIKALAPLLGGVVLPAALAAAAFIKVARGVSIMVGTGSLIVGWARAAVLQLRLVVAGMKDARVAQSAFSGKAGSLGGFLATYGKGLGIVTAIGVAFYAAGRGIASIVDKNSLITKMHSSFALVAKGADALRDALARTNGELDKASFKMIGQQVHALGLDKAFAKTGVSLGDLTAGISGTDDAFNGLMERLGKTGKLNGEQLTSIMAVRGQYVRLTGDAKDTANTMDLLGAAAKRQFGSMKKTETGTKDLRQSLQSTYQSQVPAAARATADLAGSTDKLSKSMKGAALSGKALADAIKALDGGSIGAAEAQISFRQSVLNLTEGIKDNGKALLGNSKGALANRSAFLGALDAAKAHAQALLDAGRSADTVKKALHGDVDALVAQAKNAHLSGDAIRELLTQMGMMPSQIDKALGATKKFGNHAGADAADNIAKGVASKKGAIGAAGKDAGTAAATGIANSINGHVRNVKDAMSNVHGAIVSAGSGWDGTLTAAGFAVINGLNAAMVAAIPAIQATLQGLTGNIPLWKGPEKVDKKLLRKAGEQIMEGFIKGLQSRFDSVKSALQTFTAELPKITDPGLRKWAQSHAKHLNGLLNQWQSLNNKLQQKTDDYKSILDDAVNYRGTIKDNIINSSNVTDMQAKTFADLEKQMKAARYRTEKFAETLAALKKKGLNKTEIDQLATKGPDALGQAQLILKSGKTGIGELNKLQKSINYWADKAGATAMHAMYDNGIQTAKGLVAGLKSQRKDLEKEIAHWADTLVSTLKKKLGIKSPSRVFKALGGHVGKGFQLGMESTYAGVHKSLRKFANAVAATQFESPTISLGAQLDGIASRNLATGDSAPASQKTFNYYAAPGNTLGQEDVFAATQRSRFAW